MTNPTAEHLLNEILASKIVTDQQVGELKKLIDTDWVVDHHEAELLFQINHALGDRDESCAAWPPFFESTISRLLVMDMETPGEIDQEEGDWLGGLFEKYATNNSSEAHLKESIKKLASNIEGKVTSHL